MCACSTWGSSSKCFGQKSTLTASMARQSKWWCQRAGQNSKVLAVKVWFFSINRYIGFEYMSGWKTGHMSFTSFEMWQLAAGSFWSWSLFFIPFCGWWWWRTSPEAERYILFLNNKCYLKYAVKIGDFFRWHALLRACAFLCDIYFRHESKRIFVWYIFHHMAW